MPDTITPDAVAAALRRVRKEHTPCCEGALETPSLHGCRGCQRPWPCLTAELADAVEALAEDGHGEGPEDLCHVDGAQRTRCNGCKALARFISDHGPKEVRDG